jgi:hypothetical protein
MADDGRQAAIAKLRQYDERFTAILNLIGDNNQLFGEQRQQAQDLLRDLKDSLEADCKDLHRRREQLNNYEWAYVDPALREANARISVRVNSIPGSEWHSNLYSARVDITYRLDQLSRAT